MPALFCNKSHKKQRIDSSNAAVKACETGRFPQWSVFRIQQHCLLIIVSFDFLSNHHCRLFTQGRFSHDYYDNIIIIIIIITTYLHISLELNISFYHSSGQSFVFTEAKRNHTVLHELNPKTRNRQAHIGYTYTYLHCVSINLLMESDVSKTTLQNIHQCIEAYLWPLLLTWFNFNPSMDK